MPNPKLKEYLTFKSNPNLALFKAMEALKNEMDEKVKEITEQVQKDAQEALEQVKKNHQEEFSKIRQEKSTIAEEVFKNIQLVKGNKGDKGEKGEFIKGDKGDKGDKGEKGEKGKDSTIPGQKGLQGIAGKSGKDGKDGIDGQPGEDGKDGSPDKPEEIATKLNTLTEAVDRKVIKGLETFLKNLSRQSPAKGGGMGQPKHEVHTISPSTTTITLDYNVAAKGTAIFAARVQGQTVDLDVHYSVSGKTVTLLFTPGAGQTKFSISYVRT